MSNQLPAHLLALFNSNPEITEIGKNLVSDSFSKIRYNGKKFKLIKSTGEEFVIPDAHLDIIVVGINENKSHVVYGKAYDPKEDAQAPVWSSDDGTPVPAEHEGKVVSDYYRWAVLVVGHEDMGIFELRLASASMTASKKFASAIRSHTGSVSAVVTRLTFDPSKDHPALVFAPTAYIDEVQATKVKGALTDGKHEIAVAVGLAKSGNTPQLTSSVPAPQLTASVAEAPKVARTRAKKEEPVAQAQVFNMPVQSAAQATVVEPKATSPDLNALIANVLGK